jgi:nicotinamide-nucleotide amidase
VGVNPNPQSGFQPTFEPTGFQPVVADQLRTNGREKYGLTEGVVKTMFLTKLQLVSFPENVAQQAAQNAANSAAEDKALVPADLIKQPEILSIGDEIVSGQLLDTNAQWLSLRLEELGIPVLYHTSVGDSLLAMVDAFRAAVERADLVISTGGLGPTADDLTRDALARLTGRPLCRDEASLEHICGLFSRRNRPMPAQNEVQAMSPEGSRVVFNPHGTAPGIDLDIPREGRPATRWFALPGVPAEMVEMWNGSVASEIGALAAGQKVIRRRKINCFGAGESQIEALLPDLIRRGRSPTVGITASKTTISLRITAEGPTEEACNALIEPVAATIRECLGKLVFGEGDEELQHAVLRLLRERNKTLATVEWGTAGLLADWLGAAAEKKCFLGGLVIENRATLGRVLGLDQELLLGLPDSSEELLKTAAAACRERFGADYVLAVGCFPEFNLDDPKPVYLALAEAGGLRIKSVPFAGHPATLKIYIAKQALNLLRLTMLDL